VLKVVVVTVLALCILICTALCVKLYSDTMELAQHYAKHVEGDEVLQVLISMFASALLLLLAILLVLFVGILMYMLIDTLHNENTHLYAISLRALVQRRWL